MMELSVNNFKKNGIRFSSVFSMRSSLDHQKLYEIGKIFSDNGVRIGTALRRLKCRTSADYYHHILAAQTEAMKYAIHSFPPYKLLLPDVLMDDWLSIMGPHQRWRRDHSLHQPLTAYIVSELFKGGKQGKGLVLSSGKSLLEECARMFLEMPGTGFLRNYYEDLYGKGLPPKGFIRDSWARAIFYQTAIIAALFHDIGYPWQFINKVGSHIDIINNGCVGSYDSMSKGIFDYIRDRLLIYPFYGYSDTPLRRPTTAWDREVEGLIGKAYCETHGFSGALAFMYLNDAVRKFLGTMNIQQAECLFIQDWASVGIMMHDMVWQYYGKNKRPDQPRYKLSIDKDPLSCIIAMADILEEFGRPLAKFDVSSRKVGTTFDYPCQKTTIKVTGNVLEITYHYKSQAEKARHEKERKDEVNSYFNASSGFIDFSKIGIERVSCEVK